MINFKWDKFAEMVFLLQMGYYLVRYVVDYGIKFSVIPVAFVEMVFQLQMGVLLGTSLWNNILKFHAAPVVFLLCLWNKILIMEKCVSPVVRSCYVDQRPI